MIQHCNLHEGGCGTTWIKERSCYRSECVTSGIKNGQVTFNTYSSVIVLLVFHMVCYESSYNTSQLLASLFSSLTDFQQPAGPDLLSFSCLFFSCHLPFAVCAVFRSTVYTFYCRHTIYSAEELIDKLSFWIDWVQIRYTAVNP